MMVWNTVINIRSLVVKGYIMTMGKKWVDLLDYIMTYA